MVSREVDSKCSPKNRVLDSPFQVIGKYQYYETGNNCHREFPAMTYKQDNAIIITIEKATTSIHAEGYQAHHTPATF